MQLEEFFNYKNELMKTLCCNEAIVRLVTDSSSAPVPNYDIGYTQIFPYEFVPETVDDAKTFICFDVDVTQVLDKTFYVPALYVWVFTHKSKLRLPDGGGIRLDQLSVEIDKELNGSKNFGLGYLDLQSVVRFSPINDYLGRVLTYRAIDFNRPTRYKHPPTCVGTVQA